jgi:hypothetical protein
MPLTICSETVQYVVVWYDAYPGEVFSGLSVLRAAVEDAKNDRLRWPKTEI